MTGLFKFMLQFMLKPGENLRPRIARVPENLSHSDPVTWVSTWFYTGLLRPASGSWGSLAALPFAYLFTLIPMLEQMRLVSAAFFIILFYAIGVWSSGKFADAENNTDPASVVIDEVVGMWICLLFTPPSAVWWGVAFLAFRFFDIAKVFPANWCEKNLKGGLGVMTDDVVAGIYAGIVVMFLSGLKYFAV
ncbi:MAG: phosphatidylglycerophosphatase A [Alphaproteobacteria bacterium]|nr:phosphatidylglycerophosphatase A [Alphaproteobacteria bacterium]